MLADNLNVIITAIEENEFWIGEGSKVKFSEWTEKNKFYIFMFVFEGLMGEVSIFKYPFSTFPHPNSYLRYFWGHFYWGKAKGRKRVVKK